MSDETVDKLEQLWQLTLDEVFVFEEALGLLENGRIKNKLVQYNDEHIRQLDELERLIFERSGKRLERKRGDAGISNEALALLRSGAGDSHILKALRQLEHVVRENYLEALRELGGDEEVSSKLNHNFAMEDKHLAYIREALANPSFFEDGNISPGPA